MTRHLLAFCLVAVLAPSALAAQTTLTIEADAVEVRESSTAEARVIGLAPRGHMLQVTRDDGDWVAVVWPEGTTGVGYVRLTIGSLAVTGADTRSIVNDVRAEVDAVEREMFAIWAGRSHSPTAPHDHPSQ